ncbi:hypothetical protein SP6_62_00470 [Sphingomonas paucimobilis NBRC 13935]|uniref:DNA, contig: SP662 n=1 Tax=Sphingomonas paucimobilis NBRC 13935 TaxID=1219050 RepID=A0A0C9M5U1_SPHPI|nr:hypothetical protein SP6_62_00470 [Sphingomonas paucimobilis NBRC 13935]
MPLGEYHDAWASPIVADGMQLGVQAASGLLDPPSTIVIDFIFETGEGVGDGFAIGVLGSGPIKSLA